MKNKWLKNPLALLSQLLLTLVGFFTLSTAFSASIFNITTADRNVTVSVNQTATFTYTVQNTSGVSQTQMRYTPPSGTQITTNNCGSTIAGGASCTVLFSFQAPSTPGTVTLGPFKVCSHNGALCSQSNASNRVTITIVTTPPPSFTLTPSVLGGNGTISPNTPVTVVQGGMQTFTATPDSGFITGEWLVDGVVQPTPEPDPNIFTITNVQADHTIEVVFFDNSLVITPSAGANGAISPSTPQTVTRGSDITFTGLPDPGFAVDTWSVDGTPVQSGGATFTLSDITTDHTVNVTFSGIVAVVAGDVGGTSPQLATSTDGGVTWNLQPTGVLTGSFSALSCSGSGLTGICSVGGNDDSLFTYILAVSQDGGGTWSQRTVTTGSFYPLFGMGCTGNDTTGICAFAAQTTGVLPGIAASTDGANTWLQKSISGGFGNGNLENMACTGSAPNAVCVAGGSSSGGPLAVMSTDSGNTWSVKTLQGAGGGGSLLDSSCVGQGTTAICVVAGVSAGTYLGVTRDGGTTAFVSKTISGVTPTQLSTVGCTGTGDTAICAVGGRNNSGGPKGFIGVSQDGGQTWQLELQTVGDIVFNAASCTGSGSTAVCVVVGQVTGGAQGPIYYSTDGGANWTLFQTAESPVILRDVSCSGQPPSLLCVAVGSNTATDATILYTSTDGSSWTARTITGAPANVVLRGAAIVGGGPGYALP